MRSAGPATFMAHIAQVGHWVEGNPSRLVLLGAEPTQPEVEWIRDSDLSAS